MTLCYVWGPQTGSHVLDTGVSLVQLNNQTNYTDLPTMFQDAVVLTRKLSFQYLQVDRLCIDQNLHEDFEKDMVIFLSE